MSTIKIVDKALLAYPTREIASGWTFFETALALLIRIAGRDNEYESWSSGEPAEDLA
jgi:hypothetical protein